MHWHLLQTGTRQKLEGSTDSEIYFESFTDEDLLQVFRIKP
jgi:hypothetical protein